MLLLLSTLQNLWDWIDYWMTQSADQWHPLSWAMGFNPIIIGLHAVSGITLALAFYIIAGLMIYGVRKKGFFSKEHKIASYFFIVFIALCASCFALKTVVLYMPLFWVYGAVKFLTAIAAVLTTVVYVGYFPSLMKLPSKTEWDELEAAKNKSERKAQLLKEHLDSWNKNVGLHIQVLKGQHKAITSELEKKGLPVIKPEEIHTTDETSKQQALESLDRIRLEIETLSETLNNIETE